MRAAAVEAARLAGEPYEKRKREAFETLGVMCSTMALMAALAAPRALSRMLARGGEGMKRERLLKLLDAYLALVEKIRAGEFHDATGDLARTEEPSRRVRALLETWETPQPAPPSLVQAARDYFPAFEWSGPEEGWDAWDGAPDDEP